ncbi:MAG: Ppx/GppA family phosphatase [Geminicoccaceae bacterium]|nr:MAG: Ppx/GppA family phosphatase [Geminicoccaceae bacterium]
MATSAQQKADPRGVGLIDIGSNSVRLVVVDAARRAPVVKFNEKAMCALGRGLRETGRLGDAEMAATLTALTRYFGLARSMGVAELDVFATEAVRAATNGPTFVAEIERRFGVRVDVLTGSEEARFSALGVVSEFPHADGVVGDLGGASLELAAIEPVRPGVVQVAQGQVGAAISYPFGPLRMAGLKGSRKALGASLQAQIEASFPVDRVRGRTFYAVGGAWRAFAKLAMARLDHPLHIVDGYRLPGDLAVQLATLASRRNQLAASDLEHVSKRRQEGLPAAALVLAAVLRALQPNAVVFSAAGLREGRLFAKLRAAERARDPLLVAAKWYGGRESRFGAVGERLVDWTAALFADETAGERRLREAACHLSDVAWSTHPDYRDAYALDRVLHLPLPGVSHPDRAFLALAIYLRYRGNPCALAARTVRALAGESAATRAIQLGQALQLAYRLSGATAHLIACSRLEVAPGRIRLVLPDDGSLPLGEAVERRLATLAKTLAIDDFAVERDPNAGAGQPTRLRAT